MIKSFRKNRTGILLMVLSSLCVSFGQLLWKLAATGDSLLLIPGFGLYGLGALIMIVAYKFGSLSVLQPMLSMNYVLSIVLAGAILNEQVSVLKVMGVFVIMIGVTMIGGGDD
jgi:undecaprenyl phosphate-alpha-L-ara4N flippase subunit ArnE